MTAVFKRTPDAGEQPKDWFNFFIVDQMTATLEAPEISNSFTHHISGIASFSLEGRNGGWIAYHIGGGDYTLH